MLFSNNGKKTVLIGGSYYKKTGKVETIPGVTFVKPKYVFRVAVSKNSKFYTRDQNKHLLKPRIQFFNEIPDYVY